MPTRPPPKSPTEAKDQRFDQFWSQLTLALAKAGMKETQLSIALNSPTYINKLKKFRRLPRTDKLVEIAEILGVEPSALIHDEDGRAAKHRSRANRKIADITGESLAQTLRPILDRRSGAIRVRLTDEDWRALARDAREWLAAAGDGDVTSHLAQFLLLTLAIILTRHRPDPPPDLVALRPQAEAAAAYLLSLCAPLAAGRK